MHIISNNFFSDVQSNTCYNGIMIQRRINFFFEHFVFFSGILVEWHISDFKHAFEMNIQNKKKTI